MLYFPQNVSLAYAAWDSTTADWRGSEDWEDTFCPNLSTFTTSPQSKHLSASLPGSGADSAYLNVLIVFEDINHRIQFFASQQNGTR